MVYTTSPARTSTTPLVEAGDGQTGESTTKVNPSSERPLVNVEKTLQDAVDLEPSGTNRFEK